jgi:hypothetical protein
MQPQEFQEIAHSGGQVTLTISTTKEGRRQFSVGYRHSRPVPLTLVGVQALPQGIPVAPMLIAGIGAPLDLQPGLIPVLIASDSQDQFGHQCPSCGKYWRSGPDAQFCPYCRHRGARHIFLTLAQRAYVEGYCDLLNAAYSKPDGEHVIDMDAVADAAGKNVQKPDFYYAEESQQNKFTCSACGEFNDVLGTYVFCSGCGTRNDLDQLRNKTLKALRERINKGSEYEACVKEAVAAFDSYAGKYVTHLMRVVRMTNRRKKVFEGKLFHNLRWVAENLKTVFDIDLFRNVAAEDVDFAVLMFHRRHVYEHKGGEADKKYLDESGDTTIRLGQALHESQDSAHRTANIVTKLASNLDADFHEIIPPDMKRVEAYAAQQKARS